MGLSTIQWTDYTFNPWIGCRKVAPECANCYAETLDRNRYSKTLAPGTKEKPVSHWGSGPRHRTKTWGDPLKWNVTKYGTEPMICDCCGNLYGWPGACMHTDNLHRPRVFCASLADWLDDENVPIEWFADLLTIIHDTPNLDWLLLTKRPQNFMARMKAVRDSESTLDNERGCFVAMDWRNGHAPENVWLGVSAGANQQAALDIPARVHFLSCEPMLRPLDTTHAAQFDWIIFGGESGSKARMCDLNWIRDGVAFCRANGVAPFVKQLGSTNGQVWPTRDAGFGMPLAIRDSHGGDMDEWPEDLRVREFPKL